ncbi:MAG: carbon-nitrogen family hydrolase [Deltaproteobacteria bacterium]|nr:carbon-nitrogen family hydrolase [Deltaproteobacteria bacterium]
MRVASIQMAIGDQPKEENLRRAEQLIDGLGRVDLVLLPEIWNVGYFSFDLYAAQAEDLSGETVSRLSKKAVERGCWVFGGSFVERRGDGLYNTSVLITPQGQVAAAYRKMHLFGFQSEESKLLRPGTEVVVAPTPLATFGITTCYDLRFPELYRKMAVGGAEVFLVASAWPYPRLEAWQILNRARAIENQVFLVSSNCVGVNRGSRYCGHSMIVDPWGIILASGGDEECVLEAELPVEKVAAVRKVFPAFTDRRLPV